MVGNEKNNGSHKLRGKKQDLLGRLTAVIKENL